MMFDKTQIEKNNHTLNFGCMKFSRNIINFIGEYCLEGVIASNLAVLTKIVT